MLKTVLGFAVLSAVIAGALMFFIPKVTTAIAIPELSVMTVLTVAGVITAGELIFTHIGLKNFLATIVVSGIISVGVLWVVGYIGLVEVTNGLYVVTFLTGAIASTIMKPPSDILYNKSIKL